MRLGVKERPHARKGIAYMIELGYGLSLLTPGCSVGGYTGG